MAYETGTATDHVDMFNKLYTFLTSNSELVSLGQQWTEVWTAAGASYPFDLDASEVMLQGPGLAGVDEVLVSFKLYQYDQDDKHGILLRGHAGLDPSSATYYEHIQSSVYHYLPCSNDPMTYWLVASGRRFILVVKNSTVYDACYGGLFLPYASPEGYPYPMAIGGASRTTVRWSDDTTNHRGSFVDPYRDSSGSSGETLSILAPAGGWVDFSNYSYSTSTDKAVVYPYNYVQHYIADFTERQQELLGVGGYLLTPCTLCVYEQNVYGTMGLLDGVFHVPGYGNAAENIVTVDGVDHLVVQNAFRTGFADYWALRLA